MAIKYLRHLLFSIDVFFFLVDTNSNTILIYMIGPPASLMATSFPIEEQIFGIVGLQYFMKCN